MFEILGHLLYLLMTRLKKDCMLFFQYMSMEAEAGTFMGIECAVSGPDGEIVDLFAKQIFQQ